MFNDNRRLGKCNFDGNRHLFSIGFMVIDLLYLCVSGNRSSVKCWICGNRPVSVCLS